MCGFLICTKISVNIIHTWLACLIIRFKLDSSWAGTAIKGLDWREQAEMTTASIVITTGSLDCIKTLERNMHLKVRAYTWQMKYNEYLVPLVILK